MIPILKGNGDLSRVYGRSQLDMESVRQTVKKILEDVRVNGDTALFAYTEKFDRVRLSADSVTVTQAETEAAYAQIPADTLAALRRAKENILSFHRRQKREDAVVTQNGKMTGILYRPVERASHSLPLSASITAANHTDTPQRR